MNNLCRFILVLAIAAAPVFALAKTDLSITATDITFSNGEPVEGDKVRIFTRVFNLGDTDVYGFVIFLKNGKEIADPQPISVKVNTYDDVFIDWTAQPGLHNIQAKIINTNLPDDKPEDNNAVQENYFIDLDSDSDGVGNKKDLDDDNDGLNDDKEIAMGTSSLNPDSDGDRVRDNVDPFPLDNKEWQDSDQDGVGDNQDADNDNDGLTNDEEIFWLGTNPLNSDSDEDSLSDKEEISLGTNPLREDSDEDGVMDSEDQFPLDGTRSQASAGEIIESVFRGGALPFKFSKEFLWLLAVIPFIYLFLRKRWV